MQLENKGERKAVHTLPRSTELVNYKCCEFGFKLKDVKTNCKGKVFYSNVFAL